jgi:hypothetical protein
LPKYRLENKSSRYFVVIGLPEQKVLYPYVDEYWSFQGDELNKEIFFDSEGIQNNNKKTTTANLWEGNEKKVNEIFSKYHFPLW